MRSLSNRIRTIEKKLSEDSDMVTITHVREELDEPYTEVFHIYRGREHIETLHSKEELVKKYGNRYKVELSIVLGDICNVPIEELK
jgi:ABC-type multidrug transport system ATPase subunit